MNAEKWESSKYKDMDIICIIDEKKKQVTQSERTIAVYDLYYIAFLVEESAGEWELWWIWRVQMGRQSS